MDQAVAVVVIVKMMFNNNNHTTAKNKNIALDDVHKYIFHKYTALLEMLIMIAASNSIEATSMMLINKQSNFNCIELFQYFL